LKPTSLLTLVIGDYNYTLMGKTMNSWLNNGDSYLVGGLEHEFSHWEFHNPN
jgi:hypothetical protein